MGANFTDTQPKLHVPPVVQISAELHLQFTAEALLEAAGAEADDADHEDWSGGWAVDCGGVPLCHGSALGRRSREMS
jgi:hypothetical protein